MVSRPMRRKLCGFLGLKEIAVFLAESFRYMVQNIAILSIIIIRGPESSFDFKDFRLGGKFPGKLVKGNLGDFGGTLKFKLPRIITILNIDLEIFRCWTA